MTEVQGATGFMVETSQQSKLEMSFVEACSGSSVAIRTFIVQ